MIETSRVVVFFVFLGGKGGGGGRVWRLFGVAGETTKLTRATAPHSSSAARCYHLPM